EHGVEIAGRLSKLVKRRLNGILQGVLKQQIVDRIGGKPELGKQHQGRLGRAAFFRKPDCLGKILGDIRRLHARHACGDPDEVVRIKRCKISCHRAPAADCRGTFPVRGSPAYTLASPGFLKQWEHGLTHVSYLRPAAGEAEPMMQVTIDSRPVSELSPGKERAVSLGRENAEAAGMALTAEAANA